MKGRTFLLHFGLCGFGWTGGVIGEVRLGVLRVGWCRGWLGERMRWWHEALRQARESVKR